MSSSAFNRAVTRVQWPKKKEDSQADATAPTFQSPPTQTHTLKHTHTHMRAQSQMGKGKAVALLT